VRIWHQGFVELETVPRYVASLVAHVNAVASPGTIVALHGLGHGTYTPNMTAADLARHPELLNLGLRQVVDNVVRAEREGYDAAAITIVQNIGMREARAAVRIPVASYGEAAMRYARERGDRFAVVAFDPGIARIIEDEISRLGFAEHAAPVCVVETDYGGVVEAFDRPTKLVEAFTAAARRSIAEGAHLLIPGQTIMAEALWRQGVDRIGRTPVVDALAVTIAAAERAVHGRVPST
jgi:allantoin racemase